MNAQTTIASASIIHRLLRDISDTSVSVSQLLITAKIVATRLGQQDALVWINRELSGYSGVEIEEIPRYRILRGRWKALNPMRGWSTVQFESVDAQLMASSVTVRDTVVKLEKDFAQPSGSATFDSPEHYRLMRQSLGVAWADLRLEIDLAQLRGVVDQVRGLLLDWALELDKAGISGINMDFTAEEQKEASAVTQQFFIQNAGVVGNVTDHANVTNNQTATVTLDIGAITAMVKQARAHLTLLPEEQRVAVAPVLNEIETEAAKPQPDRGLLRELLASARTICEGAAGNLAATGIIGLIRAIIVG